MSRFWVFEFGRTGFELGVTCDSGEEEIGNGGGGGGCRYLRKLSWPSSIKPETEQTRFESAHCSEYLWLLIFSPGL
jgi:hypothetical protein